MFLWHDLVLHSRIYTMLLRVLADDDHLQPGACCIVYRSLELISSKSRYLIFLVRCCVGVCLSGTADQNWDANYAVYN